MPRSIADPAERRLAPDGLPRLLPTPAATSLQAHLDRLGPLPRARDGLIHQVERAGLRGRGGAGFPTATKLKAVAAGRRSIVVANGTEGEPASTKDKSLMVLAPHLVLDGAIASAAAVGASEIIVCVERSATEAMRAMSNAVAERRRARLDPVSITLQGTPSRYIAGEESALVHWLNGGEAKPTFTPPRPFERGVRRRPTLVQNVETLANVAMIARFGAEWFRTVGTDSEPGATLVTVSGSVTQPGVYEVPFGTSLTTVIGAAGASSEVTAVLTGGYFGTWIPASALPQARLGTEWLAPLGASVGCGVLGVIGPETCGLSESARITRWLAGQNAGQCGPCVFGLDAIAGAIEALVAGDNSRNSAKHLDRWLGMVTGRGACRHPDGVARFVRSSLTTFADEIVRHRRWGPCPHTTAPSLFGLPRSGGWR